MELCIYTSDVNIPSKDKENDIDYNKYINEEPHWIQRMIKILFCPQKFVTYYPKIIQNKKYTYHT